MSIKRKFTGIILTLAMVFTLVPASAFAESAEEGTAAPAPQPEVQAEREAPADSEDNTSYNA